MYIALFLTLNTCLKGSVSTAVGPRCVYLMMKLSLQCMTVHKRCLGFSVTAASKAYAADGDSCPGPEAQQAGFRAWAPSEDQMREI